MKAILEFDLPDENYEFERAVEGRRWQWFAHSLNEYIKKEKKWNEELTDGEYKVLERMEKKFWELLEEEQDLMDEQWQNGWNDAMDEVKELDKE